MKPLRYSLILVTTMAIVCPAQSARKYGGCYSEQRINNLRRNCEKYDWARRERDKATSAAAQWATFTEEDLWRLVPGQDLPRCIDVTFDTITTGPRRLGCLKCGDRIFRVGNYPYEPDFDRKPWKLTCPSCGVVFPTNDFGKYYESGIDEHGLFNPAKADRSLLFNTEHPDPKDPLHKFGVDDGFVVDQGVMAFADDKFRHGETPQEEARGTDGQAGLIGSAKGTWRRHAALSSATRAACRQSG